MRFSLNGWSSKLDFDDIQLMTVSEPEIKMAAINRKQVRKTQVSAAIQGTNGNPKTKPAFLWLRNTTGLMWALCDVGVSHKSKMATKNWK